MKNKCIFLDRDGTIIVYKELLHKKEDVVLLEKAAEAIRLINDHGFLAIVVTNQPVVARNLCSLEEMWAINRRMEELLAAEDAYLDDIFACPHHPDRGFPGENKAYKIKCECRKPGIGMIKEATNKYNIDLKKSYLIGDTTTDIMTGKNAGLKTILVQTGLGGQDGKYNVEADYKVPDLYKAVTKIILKGEMNG